MLSSRQIPPEGCVSELTFDEWRAGELAEADVQRLQEHIAACDRCRARHAVLNEAAEAFLARFPEPPMRAGVPPLRAAAPQPGAPPHGRRAPSWLWGSGLAAALAAAAAYALLLRTPAGVPGVEGSGSPSRAPSELGTRIKGTARFGFAVRRGGEVFPGVDGQRVQPGDRLRFFVATSEPRYLAILSLDGAGNVTEYYPGDGRGRAVPVAPQAYLESSVELDQVLGKESLWAVFCAQPFEVAPLARSLNERRELTPPAGCSLDRLDLDKQAPR